MSPRTDLCDTCQHFRNDLQYNARKEEEARDLLKKYKEHLVKAKLERNYYNKNTKLAEQQRKLLRLSTKRSRSPFRSTDEIIGKGPNGTLSMVFDGIKRLNKGEKHLKITCGNAGGQNKNNATI
ncbi:hypothetical protein G9A89_021786 [Geosiphon pyriformis]|nr:hypothetical protein G9A89_021786 [Geosiphon pyriformis]